MNSYLQIFGKKGILVVVSASLASFSVLSSKTVLRMRMRNGLFFYLQKSLFLSLRNRILRCRPFLVRSFTRFDASLRIPDTGKGINFYGSKTIYRKSFLQYDNPGSRRNVRGVWNRSVGQHYRRPRNRTFARIRVR